MGYVNELVERMDKSNLVMRFESFQIETASRKTFRQLTDHYMQLDRENKEKTKLVSAMAESAKKRAEAND